MKLKKLLVAISAVLLLSSIGPISPSSAVDDGFIDCGTSGTFRIVSNVVVSHTSCTGSAIIPYGVTSIADNAFNNASSLTSVDIPSSLTSIGANAFRYSALSSLSIPSSVTSIGSYAFQGLSSLTSLSIPSSLTSITLGAFHGASKLTSLSIPSSVTSIGNSAFFGASKLTFLSIPSSVTSIGASAFQNASSLTSLSIPSSVTSISNSAFYGASSLTSLSIPSSVTSIGSSAFYGASKLPSLSIPSSVTSIGGNAFFGASKLSSLSIPSSVTSIGAYAFATASSLTSVSIPSSVTSIGSTAFGSAVKLEKAIFSGNAPSGLSAAFTGTPVNFKIYYPYGATGYSSISAKQAYCQVIFNSKGGSPVPNGTFDVGGSITSIPDNPTRNGYTYQGWSTFDGGDPVDVPFSPIGTSDITLYAVWAANTNAVVFDSAGGSVVDAGSFLTGGSLSAPISPTRAGYTFAGWSATNGGSAVAFPYSPGVTTDITLYALWAAPSHTVTFDSKSGSAVSAGSFVEGQSFEAPTSPTLSGYTFQGWSATDGGSAVSFPYSPGVTTDITLYALWSANTNTVTYNSKGGSSVSSSSYTTGGPVGTSYRLLNGYNPPLDVAASAALELGVKLSASESGWVRKVIFFKYLGDTSVHSAHVWSANGTLLASQDFTNETASGWQTLTLDNPVYIGADQQFAVSVFSSSFYFNAREFANLPSMTLGPLTIVDSGYAFTNTSAYPSFSIGYNYFIDLDFSSTPVSTRSGYTFQGWSATDGGSALDFPYTPNVTSDITLYALWSANSNVVTFNSNGGSVVGAGSFLSGGSLAAPTSPTRTGYSFLGWSATDGGSAVSFPYSPGVTTDITLYAKWTAKTYAVSYNSKGGTSIAAGSFTTGGSVASAPKVPTRSGYTFGGWSATDGGSAVSFPYSPGVASNVSLYAKWTVLPPVMGLTSASTLLPGSLVSLNVSRVNQGCTVIIGWADSGLGIEPVSKVVKSDRTTGVFTIATPTTAGTYTLSTSEISAECAGGSAVTLTQSVVVGKSLSITAKVSSSSGYAAKSPVFSVTGTVKSGSAAVSGKQVSVSLRRNGVEVKTATGTTSSLGVLSVVFTGTTYVAGDYTAVITGVADSTYLAAQVTTAKLTLR